MKIWRTDNERLQPDCIQQLNTGDGGNVGMSDVETTTALIFEGTMNGTLYCDVLQQELTQSMGKLPNKSAYMFQQDLAPWHISKLVQEKMAKLKLNVFRMASKRPESQSI